MCFVLLDFVAIDKNRGRETDGLSKEFEICLEGQFPDFEYEKKSEVSLKQR